METITELLKTQISTQSLICIPKNYNKLAASKRTVAAVRNRINNLRAYWDACQACHARLCTIADEDTRRRHEYFTQDMFLAISDSFEEVMDFLTEILEKMQPTAVLSNTNEASISHEVKSTVVQLPRIDIPKFSGEITKWETFRDVFDSLVSSRSDLTNVQKLHYLKANLTGEASSMLANTHVTDANYKTAWELLRKRYDNPQAIVNVHLQSFMDLPGVSSQSVSDLKYWRVKKHDINTALLNLRRPVD